MRTIGHEELEQKLDRQDHFRLVMALGEWAYQAKHIPGSLHFATMQEALHSLNKEDEIVVYCSDENCIASKALGQLLERNGYTHVLHFAGGLQEWEQSGYPLVQLGAKAIRVREQSLTAGRKGGSLREKESQRERGSKHEWTQAQLSDQLNRS